MLIHPGQLPELEHVLGKKVQVKRKTDGLIISGTLQFVGVLPIIPSWGLVCTVDRLPGIQINSIADIKLYEDIY